MDDYSDGHRRFIYLQLKDLSWLKSSRPSVHSWTSIISHGWTYSPKGSLTCSMMHSTGFESIGPSSRKPVSTLTTQAHSPYPANMPWHITGFILKTSVPRAAYAHPLLKQNISPLSSDPGISPVTVKCSNRYSSQMRGITSLQVLTLISSNVVS